MRMHQLELSVSPKLHTIIGIDPGTIVTGYAVIVKDKQKPLQASVEELGTFRKRGKLDSLQRIVEMHRMVAELVHRYQPRVAVIEKAFFGINAASALKLGEARGAILCACRNMSPDIKLVEVAPTQVKQYVTGSGHASKQQVATALTKMLRFNLDRIPNDATDALALAFCHHLTSLPLRPVHNSLSVLAKRGSALLSSAGRPKKGRAQLSCVPATGLAMPPQSDPNSGN